MKHFAYLEELNLARHPFPVAPDETHFFISSHIEQVLAEMVHGIQARKGFMILAGDVGLGKTTLTRRILAILEGEGVCTSFVFHTSLKNVDLLREINRDFGMPDQASGMAAPTVGDLLRWLNDFLLARFGAGRNCAIIIDDAQNLDRESLELVRMISNLETDGQKLVQILLVGQTELLVTLESENLRQLQSRVNITKFVQPLDADEIRTYIMFKLNLAGNPGDITITWEAYDLLFRNTKGNFRRINMIMDRCLYAICHSGSRRIDGATVRLVLADLRPRQRRMPCVRPAMAAGVLVPLFLMLGAWALHLSTGRAVSAATSQEMKYFKVPVDASSATRSDSPGAAAEQAVGPEDDVAVFLKAQHLEAFAPEFNQALTRGGLAFLGDKIYRERGLQLVRLKALPATVRRRYGALAVSGSDETSTQWLLFWQPDLQLNRFYYHYQDEQIRHLQELLARAGFYHGNLDGIVGARLMKAVITFQERNGIPVNGFPDPATIFLLCHQNIG